MSKAKRVSHRASVKAIAAVVSALALMLHPSQASAAALQCTTTISDVEVSPWGIVTVRAVNLGWWYMCDLNSSMTIYYGPGNTNSGTISPAVCQAYLAKFLTAKTTQLNMTFASDFGSTTLPSCSDAYLGQWVVPNPYPYWVDFGG